MARTILAILATIAALVFGLQRAAASEAPWCAVISMTEDSVYWDCQYRSLAAAYTGVEDIYWFVPANSPINNVKDITEKHTIAYSTSGSTSDSVLRALIAHYGLKAKPTPTGGPPGTFTMTMSGQIDIGWSVAPFGLKDLQAKTIRVLMRGNDVPSMRHQTVRVETRQCSMH